MRILLGGDFHLGARLAWLGPQAGPRRNDLNRAFVRFADFALNPANSIDLVLFLGDLFDHHAPEPALVDHAMAQVERLLARGIPVAAVPGLHDGYAYPDSVYRSGRWPSDAVLFTGPHLSRTTIEVGGVGVQLYGLAYDAGKTPADPLAGPGSDPRVSGGVHIALMHLPGAADAGAGLAEAALPIQEASVLSSGFDLVAVAHGHNFREARIGNTLVVTPGTLEGLNVSESGRRSFTVAASGTHGWTIERAPHPGREIVEETIDLDQVGSESQALEDRILALAGRARIARVVLTGHAGPHFDSERLAQKLATGFFHLSIDDRSFQVDSRWASRVAGEKTVRGLFVRKMQDRIEAASGEDRPLLEAALRAGLSEFGAIEGGHAD